MNKQTLSKPILLLLAFGLLNFFASGRWTVAPATWIAPLFAMLYLAVHPQRRKFVYLYLVLWLSLSLAWYNATPIFGPAHFIFMAVNSIFGILPLVIDYWLRPKMRRNGHLPFAATLIYPLAGTTLEFLSSSASPIGNFGAVGYSQYALPALTQITAVTGLLGLTFLISWFPAILFWVWDNGFVWRKVRAGVVVYAAVLLVVVGYGAVRLANAPEIGSQETVPVASFTLNETHVGQMNDLLTEQGLDAYRRETQAVHNAYLAKTETAIQDGAKLILWPELAILGIEEDVQAVVSQGQALAQQAGVYLAMPTFTIFPESDRPAENVLYVADSNGDLVIEHVKYGGNLFEGTLPGNKEIQTVDTPYGRLSGIICWDTNFPGIVRQTGQQQADILLSPSKEWSGINPMHAEMAVFRGIENGVSVIRQTDEGLSIIADAYGRTLATGEGLADSGNYLLADVPTSSPTTIYSGVGDVVGIISTVGFVIIAAYALLAGRRQKREAATDLPPA